MALNVVNPVQVNTLGASTATAVGFYGATGTAQPSSFTTSADGSTRTLATQTASTVALSTAQTTAGFLSLGTTSLGQNPIYGFGTTAVAAGVIAGVNALTNDMQNTKEVLNAIINDLKALGVYG